MSLQSIIIATSNSGKLREIRALLEGGRYEISCLADHGIADVEETGLSFVENAILKARNAARHSGLAAIADDSGLVVDALDGRPGIYSARFAGAGATDHANTQKLLQELASVPDHQRSARFHCVMVYLRSADDPTPLISEGKWRGAITTSPQGENGFGYDPVFHVPTHHCTAAQLTAEEKNSISHRSQALKSLLEKIKRHSS